MLYYTFVRRGPEVKHIHFHGHLFFSLLNIKCLCFPGFLPSPEEFAEIHHDMKGIGK